MLFLLLLSAGCHPRNRQEVISYEVKAGQRGEGKLVQRRYLDDTGKLVGSLKYGQYLTLIQLYERQFPGGCRSLEMGWMRWQGYREFNVVRYGQEWREIDQYTSHSATDGQRTVSYWQYEYDSLAEGVLKGRILDANAPERGVVAHMIYTDTSGGKVKELISRFGSDTLRMVKTYNESGNLLWDSTFQNGQLQWAERNWYKNGVKDSTERYSALNLRRNPELQRSRKYLYYPDGKLKEEWLHDHWQNEVRVFVFE